MGPDNLKSKYEISFIFAICEFLVLSPFLLLTGFSCAHLRPWLLKTTPLRDNYEEEIQSLNVLHATALRSNETDVF